MNFFAGQAALAGGSAQGPGPRTLRALARVLPFPKRLGQPAELAGVDQPASHGEVFRLDGAPRMTAPR